VASLPAMEWLPRSIITGDGLLAYVPLTVRLVEIYLTFACRTAARLRQGKPGKGGKRCRKHRRNLSEEPSGL
jgi:hypothetical protein